MAPMTASRRVMTRSFGRRWHRPAGVVRFRLVRAATNRGRLAGAALAVLSLTFVAGGTSAVTAEPGACAQQRASAAHTQRVAAVTRSGRDVWGERLLAARSGPTYAAAARLLPPILYARAPGKKPLTDSGVYYVPLGQPEGVQGAGTVALHVADGSQVIANRVGERSLTVLVGAEGTERYGTCLRRLTPARLAEGYLPIMETGYADAAGNRYRQESFAAHDSQAGGLVSFVRLEVDAREAVLVRFRPTAGRMLSFRVGAGTQPTFYVGWLNHPRRARVFPVEQDRYDTARARVVAYWNQRLAEGTQVAVPENRVTDAMRNLLIQNLTLTYRYSIGNPYEQFSFPEGVDAAQVMAEWGHPGVARSILRTSLTRKPTPYPNWKMGEKLVGSALHYRLSRDAAYVRQATPRLRGYVEALGRQIAASASGLLARERYSSDIPNSVYGLHSQAVVWQGLQAMGRVWAETGQASLARRCRQLANRLESGLRRAVRVSQRRLPDGSLFLPAQLIDGERPYRSLMEARLGSYWNLVMPYALASGLIRPGSAEARGALRYLLRHGSRLVGVVRAGAYALYPNPSFPTSGTDQVYGINVARFLADNDEADQLVLSLYGTLAVAMTPDTFVSGEAASVTPLFGAYHRAMYLPPNGASNGAFLMTLRSMLVHETRTADGTPRGLELAFATPRPWLEPGKRIAVERMPTSFGPVSYTLEAREGSVAATVQVPERRPGELKLRLRLPPGRNLGTVTLGGRPFTRVNGQTLDLSGLRGRLELTAQVRRGPARTLAFAASTAAAERLKTRRIVIRYRAHNGRTSRAHVLLPAWYRKGNNPPIPLIISPHGRGLSGKANAANWGNLPARGSFAVVNPDARGRRLPAHSWGYKGHIDDLARMPKILKLTIPWLRIDKRQIFAFGGSMGGQETLLLVGRYPRLFAGAAAFDAVSDFALQYRNFRRISCGRQCRRLWGGPIGPGLRQLARKEVGGAPHKVTKAWKQRSPITFARQIASSCVPLQIWWSVADRIVLDQHRQSGRLFRLLRKLNPDSPIEGYVGYWTHSYEMQAATRLPLALANFGLLPETPVTIGLHHLPAPASAICTP
jgi:pimeloyl-ACP methyl ester carboxylesterase